MVNPNNGKPVKFVGALAAIAVAIEGAVLLGRKAGQAVLNLPQEVISLISAIAEGVGSTLEKLDAILNAIKSISSGGVGFPPNGDSILTTYVSCPFAQPQVFQLPSIVVPQNCMLSILARNPAGANAGVIWVSGSQVGAATNTQATPLVPNASLNLKPKNANVIWIGATVANDGVYLTVEQING
jgi:hypothetical protein